MEPIVARATPDDLDEVAGLFDNYRAFYGRGGEPQESRDFIGQRLRAADSAIYLARQGAGEALGFMQLYPSFSSVACRPLWILNDLYTRPEARRRGVGTALLQAARSHARATGAVRLVLETATDNRKAQALYESFGFVRDAGYFTYTLELA